MTARMTIEDMQLAAADLHARCTPREGFAATEASLFLNAADIAALDAIARFLALITPFRADIVKLLAGNQFKKRGAA